LRVGWLVVTRRVLGVALLLLVVALVASGAWLWFRYTPDSNWISETHRIAARALIAVAAIAVSVAIVDRVRGVAHGVVASLALFGGVVGAALTGSLVSWDQLALWAVPTGGVGNLTGVGAASADQVKYVIAGGRELSPSSYEHWSYAHLGLAGLVVVALVLLWLRTRESTPVPDDAELVRAP
jgi:quinol-cytochrome oxidoreductase complex cytochrome b subunit